MTFYHGTSKETWNDSSKYEGNYKMGKKKVMGNIIGLMEIFLKGIVK